MSQFLMPDDLNSSAALTTIFATCWDLLEAAAAGNGTGWRLPVLATQSSQGIQQRTIVLRTVLRPRNSLLFHTDVRSAKIEQLQADANASLLFYDSQLEVQLQVRGVATIHTNDETADQLWEANTPASLKMYLAPLAPGTTTKGPDCNLPDSMRGRLPERSEILPGRDHFAAVKFTVQSIEWLRLSRNGNLRAVLFCSNGNRDHSEWMTP